MDWTRDIVLLKYPQIFTQFDPVTGKGSTLDIGIVTPNLFHSVISFSVDQKKKLDPARTEVQKTLRGLYIYENIETFV